MALGLSGLSDKKKSKTSPDNGAGSPSSKKSNNTKDSSIKQTKSQSSESKKKKIKTDSAISEDKKKKVKKEAPIGPYMATFYRRDIRRYYENGNWFFSIDDVAKIADNNPDTPNLRKGDPEKLDNALKGICKKMDGLQVAKPTDIAKIIPYFKGNMPGPVVTWLIQSAQLPAPKAEDYTPRPEKTAPQPLPQDTNPITPTK